MQLRIEQKKSGNDYCRTGHELTTAARRLAMTWFFIVGAVINRPRANTVRPYIKDPPHICAGDLFENVFTYPKSA